MNKKVKSILWGSGIIVVLGIAVAVLMLTQADPQEEIDRHASSLAAKLVTLVNEQSSDVESLHIKNELDEYTITRAGEGVWRIPEIAEFAQQDYLYLETLGQASNINANEVIEENCTDLSKFGLDRPKLVIDITYVNGNEYHLTVGNRAPGSGAQYIMQEGDSTVYALPSTSIPNLYYNRHEYTEKTVIETFDPEDPSTVPHIDYVKIDRPDLEQPIIMESMTQEELGPNAVIQTNLRLKSPVNAMLSETPLQTYVFALFGMTGSEVVAANPTPEELTQYGFDEPSSTYELRYNETSTVKLTTGYKVRGQSYPDENGNTYETDCYYVIKEGINQIYVVPTQMVTWMEMQPKDIISSAAVLPNILDIESLETVVEGRKTVVDFTLGEDPTKSADITAALNGEAHDIEPVRSYLQLIMGTAIQDIYTGEVTGEPVFRADYHYRSGKTDTIEVYLLADRTAVLSLNGNKGFLGRAGYVDKIVKETQNLLDGKEIDINW